MALGQQHVPVTLIAAAQGAVERVAGLGQVTRVDEFIANALEVLAAVADHQAPLSPAPALPLQDAQVGAEDVVEAPGQEAPLVILVEDREVRTQAGAAGVGPQDPAAEAMDGADAHLGQVSRAACGSGEPAEPIPQFPCRPTGEGAQHQLLRAGQALQQDVGPPERNRQGLARARSGDAHGGPLQVPDEFQLALVKARVEA